MDSPLTPGMSTMLDFADETFEYPALEYTTTTPGAKDIYGDNFTFSQKDWDAGNKFLSAFDSPGTASANKDGIVEPAIASAQTPALTTGPSAATNSSSQASPSVAPDYFSRPRQPNSDGNSAHFVTAKPVEGNNYSEFRKAINNRFNRAKAAISAPPSNFSNADDGNQQAPPANIDDALMDFSFTDFEEAHQQSGQFRASDLDTRAAHARGHAPTSQFNQQDPSQPQSSHYPELDPELAGGEGPGSAKAQTAFIPPPESQGPTAPGDIQPPPIKRRRRRKAPPSAEVKAQKHKAFLERNREAASKCRTKKKTQIQQLEEDERDGRAINQMLKDEFRDVLGEVLLLREQVKLQDMACGGNCGGKCGGVQEGDEGEEQADTNIMEDAAANGGVERDADAELAVVNRDGNVEASGAQGNSGAGCDSGSDDGEEASDDEDADLDEDQDSMNNERAERPPK